MSGRERPPRRDAKLTDPERTLPRPSGALFWWLIWVLWCMFWELEAILHGDLLLVLWWLVPLGVYWRCLHRGRLLVGEALLMLAWAGVLLVLVAVGVT